MKGKPGKEYAGFYNEEPCIVKITPQSKGKGVELSITGSNFRIIAFTDEINRISYVQFFTKQENFAFLHKEDLVLNYRGSDITEVKHEIIDGPDVRVVNVDDIFHELLTGEVRRRNFAEHYPVALFKESLTRTLKKLQDLTPEDCRNTQAIIQANRVERLQR